MADVNRDVFCFLALCAILCVRPAQAQSGAFEYSTLAGVKGTIGSSDGTNEAAQFHFPGGLAVDNAGALYLSDMLNHTIRKLTPVGTNWVVTTIAGQAGVPGSADGTNEAALFNRPNGLAIDRSGRIFVADHYNHTIRQMVPVGTNWVVTTIAGLAGVSGSANGTNSEARFWSPTGIAIDSHENLFVTDTANFTVRELVPTGTNWIVGTIAGVALNFGFADGTNGGAQFDFPYGITIDPAGRLYIADFGNNAIREVFPTGNNWAVITLAGLSGQAGSNDGPGWQAAFNMPNSICLDQTGILYVTDQANNTIRRLTGSGTNWTVSTVGGIPSVEGGDADGLGGRAGFRAPWGLAVGTNESLYVADYANQTIRRGVFIPGLDLSVVPGRAVLSWPWIAGDYALETSSAIGPTASWFLVNSTPITNGFNVSVLDQPGSAPAFYRLVRVQTSPTP